MISLVTTDVGPGVSIVGPGIVRVAVNDETIVVVRITSTGTSVVMVDVTVVPDSDLCQFDILLYQRVIQHTSYCCRNERWSQDRGSNLAHLSCGANTCHNRCWTRNLDSRARELDSRAWDCKSGGERRDNSRSSNNLNRDFSCSGRCDSSSRFCFVLVCYRTIPAGNTTYRLLLWE